MRLRALVLLGVCAACSSTSNPSPNPGPNPSPTPTPSSDAGTPKDASVPPTPVVNGCTTYADMTAAGATIDGPMDPNPAQYSPNCVRIKAGQSVTWNVDLSAHPLGAAGGTTPSPITATSTGTSVTFTFSTPGTYGYHCMVHPTIMFGAVDVTP